QGYRLAADKAIEILNKIATKVSIDDEATLKKVAITSMTGRSADKASEHLANLVVKAVRAVSEVEGGEVRVDKDNIKVEKKTGGGIGDTEFIKGIIIDKERVHSAMPTRVEKARIALVDSAMEVKKTEIDAKIRITDPTQLKAFIDEEEKGLFNMVKAVKGAGANVLFAQKGIDDLAQHYLAKEGIFAARRVSKSDLEKLSRATAARIVSNLKEITSKDLGHAGVVEEIKIGDEKMIYVRECKNPKAVSILVRGGTKQIVDEIERSIQDCLGVVPATLIDKKVVAGGGAPEIEVAKQLRTYAKSVGGREQLAIEAFADAMEVIPRALAENAGLDPIDTLVDLRAKHEKNGVNYGIDVFEGKPIDMLKKGVIEPLRVKTQAIKSAS
ncbi:MAG: thermosome subunit beta, partial [Candidatus Hydrothermarchaeota archaeon]